jgi:hypothetical protein
MRTLILVTAISFIASAQTISGIVVDEKGAPLDDVRVEYKKVTNSDGRFANVPVPTVLRKSGYSSVFVRDGATDLHVVMKKASVGGLPQCTKRCETVEGWQTSFCFPAPPGFETDQGADVDYGMRRFMLKTKSGWIGVGHGAGPMWSFGFPLQSDIAKSVEYSEKTFNWNGLADAIIDARGKTAAGTYWRWIGKLAESASYSNVTENSARLLDQVLDGACLVDYGSR